MSSVILDVENEVRSYFLVMSWRFSVFSNVLVGVILLLLLDLSSDGVFPFDISILLVEFDSICMLVM